jgi:hypothetical protein
MFFEIGRVGRARAERSRMLRQPSRSRSRSRSPPPRSPPPAPPPTPPEGEYSLYIVHHDRRLLVVAKSSGDAVEIVFGEESAVYITMETVEFLSDFNGHSCHHNKVLYQLGDA